MKTNYCPVTIYVMFRFPKCGGDANTAVCRQNSVRQQIQAVNADRIHDSLEKDTPAKRPVSVKPDQSAQLIPFPHLGVATEQLTPGGHVSSNGTTTTIWG